MVGTSRLPLNAGGSVVGGRDVGESGVFAEVNIKRELNCATKQCAGVTADSIFVSYMKSAMSR